MKLATPRAVRRVLIIEDEAIVAMDLSEQLEAAGFAVVGVVGSSCAVIDAVQETRPDVVLMDVRLRGDCDGIMLAEEIFTCEDIPVVFLSAFADPAIIERVALTGSYGYLTKPVATAALFSTLEMAVRKHEDLRGRRGEARWLSIAINALDTAIIRLDLLGGVRFMNKKASELTGVTMIDANVSTPVWITLLAQMPDTSGARQLLSIEPPGREAVQVWVEKRSLGRHGYVCILQP